MHAQPPIQLQLLLLSINPLWGQKEAANAPLRLPPCRLSASKAAILHPRPSQLTRRQRCQRCQRCQHIYRVHQRIFYCLCHQAINPQAILKQATLKQPSSNSNQSVASWLFKQLNPTATDCLSCLLTSVLNVLSARHPITALRC
jgi:hypothetical protein